MDWPGLDPVQKTDDVWPGLDPVQPTTARAQAPAQAPTDSEWPGLDAVPPPMARAQTPAPAPAQQWPGLDAGQEEPAKPVGEPIGAFSTAVKEAERSFIALPGKALEAAGIALAGDQPIQQGSLYRTGIAMQKYADTWGAGEASTAAHPIAAGVGSTIGGFGAAAPALLAATAGAPGLATALGAGAVGLMAGAGASDTFNEALLKGANENDAAKAAGLNAIVSGGLGALPLGAMLAPVRAYAPELTGWAAQTLEKALVGGVVFTSIGEAQEFLGRQIAKTFYDPDAGYTPDVTRLLGSFIGGGVIGAITPKMLHNERTMPVTDMTIKEAGQPYDTTVAPATAEELAGPGPANEPPKVSKPTTEVTGVANTPPEKVGFTVYHGSRAKFDTLDPTKVGTGQNAATYGHAEVYVAEHPGVAESMEKELAGYFYKDQPYDATIPEHRAAMLLDQSRGSLQEAQQRADESAARAGQGPAFEKAAAIDKAAGDVLNQVADGTVTLAPLEHRGFFYTMEVNRPKEHFINWDKPLDEQSQYVKDAIAKLPEDVQGIAEKYGAASMGDFYRRLSEQFLPITKLANLIRIRDQIKKDADEGRTGPRPDSLAFYDREIEKQRARPDEMDDSALPVRGKKGASDLLRSAGIAGNRYLDAFSRDAGAKGTRDALIINILDAEKGDRAKAIANLENRIAAAEALPKENQAIDRSNLHAALAAMRAGWTDPRTYNAAVFNADDVIVTHRNGIPLQPEVQKAIRNVQKGMPVEDEHGHAIVNGHELENIGADEMNTFAQGGAQPEAAPYGAKWGPNGYEVNAKAMADAGAPDFPKTPITEASTGLRNTIKGLFPKGDEPPGMKAMATSVDFFYRRLKWLFDLRSLADGNPDIEPLVRYDIGNKHQDRMAAQWQTKGEDVWRVGRKLSTKEWDATTKFIDDYINMRYRTPQERSNGVSRAPTEAELAAMAKRHGVGELGMNFFKRAVALVREFYGEMLNNSRSHAMELEPKAQAKELGRLAAIEKRLYERPLWPVMRFGLYSITVRGGPEGEKYYRVETQREQRQLAKKLAASKHPNETIAVGKLPQSALAFSGLPKAMLDAVETQFLSQGQSTEGLRNALNQLKYENDPIRSMTGKLQRGGLIPGYSQDFLRSFSSFFYHGSRNLARMKFDPEIKQAMADLRASAATARDPVRRADIAQFVEDHYTRMKAPAAEWAIPRAFMFYNALGYKAAAATQNLTQVLLTSVPHMSAVFGELTTLKNLAKASMEIKNFYSRPKTLSMTDPASRALGELMQGGWIRAAMAPDFAATSEGRSYQKGYGKTAATVWNQFLKGASMMFELAEQTTRRSTGMATYYSALENLDNPFVKKSLEDDPRYYSELLAKGFPRSEAMAIIAAGNMIDRTMYQYGRSYRPAYMQGPFLSTVFIFKYFTHRMLWSMYNYPAAGMRTLLIMGFLGGLQGIPFFQDINGVLKAAAQYFFGKDFDLEDEARQFAKEVLNMKEGTSVWNDPMTVVKGFASRGYGIPALADFAGEWAGIGNIPIPELDRTAAVSLNNILPVDFGQFTAKGRKDPGTAFANAVSRGMGAGGSWAFNVFKAVMDMREDPDSLRRWEKVAPTFLGAISHAARDYIQGGETTRTGAQVLRFDPHDTEHMMEVLAMALGYTPSRLSKEWDRIRAESESEAFWNFRREFLLNQFQGAVVQRDPDERARVLKSIKNFNLEVRGTEARGYAISGDTLEKSIDARMLAKAKAEAGVPPTEAAIPLVRGIRTLFPGTQIDQRRVR